jgi:hypothetical protein
MNRCQFIIGAHGDDKHGNPIVDFCEAPAPIKRNGRWYCAEHYDEVEDYSTVDADDVTALD